MRNGEIESTEDVNMMEILLYHKYPTMSAL